MPKPNPNETKPEFMKRCVPILVEEGKPSAQAVAVCYSLWENRKKEVDNMEEKLQKYITVKTIAEEEDRTLTCVGTMEGVDRDGDIVKVDGIELKSYKTNPVVLWAHGREGLLPVAKATKVWKKDGNLNFRLEFAEAQHNPIAPFIYQSYKDGFLNAFSIGFLPDYSSMEYKEDKKANKQVRIINKSELFELSCVHVPANANALMVRSYMDTVNKAWEDGILDGSDLKLIEDEVAKISPKTEITEEKVAKLLKEIDELKAKLVEKEMTEETTIYDELFTEFRAGADDSPADSDHTDDDELSIDTIL